MLLKIVGGNLRDCATLQNQLWRLFVNKTYFYNYSWDENIIQTKKQLNIYVHRHKHIYSTALTKQGAFDRTMRFYLILNMLLCLSVWKALAIETQFLKARNYRGLFWRHKRWTVYILKIISKIHVYIDLSRSLLMQLSFHCFDFTVRMLEWCENIDRIYTFSKSKYQHWVIGFDRFSLLPPLSFMKFIFF